VTWEGRRFRKVKIEPDVWDKSNILVGKEPRMVSVGLPVTRVLREFSDASTPERPVGRIRGGRARIPGARAAKLMAREKESTEDLVPSTPSVPLTSLKKDPNPVVEPTMATTSPAKQANKIMRPHEHFNWYWETFPPTIKETSRANDFFVKNRNPPRLLSSAARFMQVPDSDVPEVAFVGRSNVGKSSLLNAIVDANVKDLLARTSATPGFTKTMNFYGIGPGTGVTVEKNSKGQEKIVGSGGLVIVDMPGYGEGSLLSWGVEIMKYIQSRKQLRRVFVLLDTQHGIKDKDRSLLASLRLAGVSHQVILSKMDKVYIPKAKDIKQFNNKKGYRLKPKGTVEALRAEMEKLKPEIKPPVGGGALGEMLACSSETLVDGRRLGIDHVRYAVLKAVGLDRTQKKKEERRNGKLEVDDDPEREAQDGEAQFPQALLGRL
jgi:GTP-binding protein